MNVSEFAELRKKAESILKSKSVEIPPDIIHDFNKLIEELNIYQIELELQNQELHQINENLFNEHKKYVDLFKDAPIAYFILNKTGNIIELNHSAANMLKLPISHFYRTSIFPFIERDSKTIFSKFLNKVFEDGTLEVVDIIFKDSFENPIYTKVNAVYYFDNDFDAYLCRFIVIDKTEEVLMRKQIDEANAKFHQFIFNTPDIFYEYSTIKGATFWSPQVTDILGFTQEDLNIDPFFWSKSIHEEDKPFVEKAIEDYKKGASYNVEYRIKSKSGEWKCLHDQFISKQFVGDEIIIHGHASDITERKRIELALKESEEKYRFITENSSDIIWIYNVFKQCFTYMSPAVKRILGYESEEMMGKGFELFLNPEFIPNVSEKINKAIKQHIENPAEPIFSLNEIQHIDKFGNLLWVEISSNLRMNSMGDIEIIGISRNINDRKLFEEQLKQEKKKLIESEEKLSRLNATKDMFFSIIAHDLRGPTGNFRNMVNILKNEYEDFDDNARKNVLGVLHDSSIQLHNLLENLLLWSYTQKDGLEFKPIELNLKASVENNVAQLDLTANNKFINVILNIPGEKTIFADENMFNTIIRNLITNAVKFCNRDGLIEIGIIENTNSDFNEIFVKDNGVGMTNEKLSKLFKLNQNVVSKGTAGEKGSGLGLILCYEFVNKHNGQILVESTPNFGTTFKILLPKKNNLEIL